jgi:hypothetical protein
MARSKRSCTAAVANFTWLFFKKRKLAWQSLGVALATNIIRLIIWFATDKSFEGFFPIEACASFFGGAIFVTAILVNS